jgi:hypothetical protein
MPEALSPKSLKKQSELQCIFLKEIPGAVESQGVSGLEQELSLEPKEGHENERP